LTKLLEELRDDYEIVPHVEVENECTLMPDRAFALWVNTWNNSPKLANSGVEKKFRYKPDILQTLSWMPNSYFKFVITQPEDWDEIKSDYLNTGLLRKDQIVLMPEGMSRLALQAHYQKVIDIAVREGVRMTDRLHITIYNKTVGV
jgi:organic radical activating enzyme